jgi:hypothetical protein
MQSFFAADDRFVLDGQDSARVGLLEHARASSFELKLKVAMRMPSRH